MSDEDADLAIIKARKMKELRELHVYDGEGETEKARS